MERVVLLELLVHQDPPVPLDPLDPLERVATVERL